MALSLTGVRIESDGFAKVACYCCLLSTSKDAASEHPIKLSSEDCQICSAKTSEEAGICPDGAAACTWTER